MSDPDTPDNFDDHARGCIRRKLIHYATENGIGVIRLADRISKASPRLPEITIKTLQRFLAGRMRTSDMYVRFFARFANSLPDPDPIGALGQSMAAMYNVADLPPLSGTLGSQRYAVKIDPENTFSRMTAIKDGAFSRLEESVLGPGNLIYDGVMVSTGPQAMLAVLKDRLSSWPKTFMLRIELGELSGHSWHTEYDGEQILQQVTLTGKIDE